MHLFTRSLGRRQTTIFLAATALVALLIAILVAASLLGLGGPAVQDTLHGSAEVVAGLFAGAVGLIAAVRSRGRRRFAWSCWSAYGFLAAFGQGFADWNAFVTHTTLTFPSLADMAFLAQVPAGVIGAAILMRAGATRLAVSVSLFDGLIIGAGVIVVGLANGLGPIFENGDSTLVSVIGLAEPVTDMVILTLIATVAFRVGRHVLPSPILIGAGVAAIGIADYAATYQIANGIDATGSPWAMGWTAGLFSVGLGALYAVCFRGQTDFRARGAAPNSIGMFVPVLPVALASGLAVATHASDPQIAGLLVWAMFVLIAVTLVRMCLALYINLGLGRALAHQGSHDALTGLPNRALLRRRLERTLTAMTGPEQHVTLLTLDLDGFKGINDTFGHNAGDQLLVQISNRIVTCVRDVDLVARLGGDEFAVIFAKGLPDQATVMARRVLAALELPLTLGSTTVSVDASIGLSIGGERETADELLRNADLAMHAAKASGGGRFMLYEPHMHAAVAETMRIVNALRTAWLTKDLIVHYQPIVDLASGRMVSVEALARWKHPDGDVVPPMVFIPLAEQTGLIIPIGTRVLNEACQSLARWQHQYVEAAELTISVNLSPRQLHSDELVEIVAEALRTSGVKPQSLILEVTETAVMYDMDSALRILARLKALGTRLAIDDFGVGASSLARLRRLPVDIVKIDKSLVDHVPDGHVASSLLDAVVGVVRALHLRTVLEGVERVDQAEHLREAGYDLAQGYYFARPMAGAAIEAVLAKAQFDAGGVSVFPMTPLVVTPVFRSRTVERVVVVDDDDAIGTTACRILEHEGIRAVLAPTIREAMTELSRGTDAMVIDIGMPDGDGWNLISSVRADRVHGRMPMVVMTGLLDSAEVLNRAYDLECEYLGKPFAPEALIAKIRSAQDRVSVSTPEAVGAG